MFEFGNVGPAKGRHQHPAMTRLAELGSARKVEVLEALEPNAPQTRIAERFVPHRTTTTLTTAKGRRIEGRIVNLSSAAVAIEANLPDVKADPVVMAGSRPVRAGRRIRLGMVFLFVKPIDRSLCNPNIIL